MIDGEELQEKIHTDRLSAILGAHDESLRLGDDIVFIDDEIVIDDEGTTIEGKRPVRLPAGIILSDD